VNDDHIRQTVLPAARSVVVKIGTAVLTDERGLPDLAFLERMAAQVAQLQENGVRVTLVCSGAVGAGMAELGLRRPPAELAHQQAVAAVGQSRLMSHWRTVLTPHGGLRPAQLLLTRQDFESRQRFLNIRGCIGRLHRAGCIPVANENDTVAVEELRFGDNDMLAALLCNAMRADALMLLTSVAGLLDERGQLVPLVSDVAAARDAVSEDASALGRGGMASTLEAAELVAEAGEVAVIADGRAERVLPRLFDGETVGTLIAPGPRKLDARRRWIGLTRRAVGTICVDEGAARAIETEGKSLLAIGTTAVHGHFEEGAVVRVLAPDGRQIARGVVNFAAEALARIAGQRSEQIPRILGRPTQGEVIHRDNLIRRNVS
jgi:glutamate 5-kinase